MTNSEAIYNTMLHEIGHTFGLAHCVDCAQGSSIMTAFSNDCLCASFPCDHEVPFNGVRFGCPPLDGPRDCDENAVNNYANYPPTTTTPTPTPTPCAQLNESCYFPSDCCAGTTCGNISFVCISCEPNPQALGENCMSEVCRNCYGEGGTYCTGDGGNCWTPILVDVQGNGFQLTNATNGVNFDDGKGTLLRTAWTVANGDDAWLVLDRNGNGTIDNGTELFGNAAPQPETTELHNGFRALNEYDQPTNGGNDDAVIDHRDAVYSLLHLWQDRNHNGVSEADELNPLSTFGFGSIDLDYKLSKRKDANGNTFRYRAKVTNAHGVQLRRWAYDVFLDARKAQ